MEQNKIDADKNPVKQDISKTGKKIKRNPWAIVSLILFAVIVVYAVLSFSGITGNFVLAGTLSADDAGNKLVTYLNERIGGGVEYKSAEEMGDLYKVMVSYQGQETPVFITKDGKYFVKGALPIDATTGNSSTQTSTQTPTEIPKSDKPVVELYVFTYCPYGTQAEKGIIPVVKLLGSKIDFKIRQIGAMHGEFEKIEAQRQLCINKLYPAKFLDYVNSFVSSSEIGACSGDAACVGPLIDELYTKLGINKAKIDSCMKNDGVTLYAAEEANSKTQGVSGSPTLIINGADAQSGRDSASYLKTICSAFNAAPAECSQTLSTASPSPGFGASASASGSNSASCS